MKLPIIRNVSSKITPFLLLLPLSANHLSILALLTGILSCWAYILEGPMAHLIGALLFTVSYTLDNCDGEVARARNQCSSFGDKLDTFVDWLVHTAFFFSIGYQVMMTHGEGIWFILGFIASMGCSINYFIGIYLQKSETRNRDSNTEKNQDEEKVSQKIVYVFRELFRADFCFIVLILTILDSIWLLLPAAAIGAQVYWILIFFKTR